MSPPKSVDAVGPAAAPVAKRTTRSTNNDGDDVAAPASKRQRKDEPVPAGEAAAERLDVEAPRKSTSPAGDAPRVVKKIAKTKDNIRSMIAHGKGKGKGKATDPTEDDPAASATVEVEPAVDGPKGRGRKPLPTVSSPKLEPASSPRHVEGDDLANIALGSVADKDKENLAMRGKKAGGRATGKKNFIDAQDNAEKVSQIADFEEENDQQIRREAEAKSAQDESSVAESDIDNNKPEVISMAGVKRRGKPLTRDIPRVEENAADVALARDRFNAEQKANHLKAASEEKLRRENAERFAERERETREEFHRNKVAQANAGADNAAALRPEDGAHAAPSPSFSDMKAVAKQKAALHRQQRGTIKPRKPWSADEEDTFARLIEQHGCNWAQLERTDEMKAFGGRTQSQLKDKAMNMKALIMKAEAPLPKNFQFISLRATQKEDIRSLGIDPDNYPY